MKNFSILTFIALFYIGCDDGDVEICALSDADRVFSEAGGVLVLEAESTSVTGDWMFANATPDFTGSGYLQWTGENFFSEPGNGLLTYNLSITTTGTYRFQWRSRINEGDNSTESNDAWLRFPNASDFFGDDGNGSIVYPGGSGKSPNPNGQSKEGWFKIYQSQLGRWSSQARTSDEDPHNVFVTFNSVGIYTMEISGRSTGFALDRIMLSLDDVPVDVTDPSVDVSEVGCDLF